jgi:hypothetical protein
MRTPSPLEVAASGLSRTVAAFHKFATVVHLAVIEIHRMRKPMIAVINRGDGRGSFSIGLACNFWGMAESARLRQGRWGWTGRNQAAYGNGLSCLCLDHSPPLSPAVSTSSQETTHVALVPRFLRR